MKERRIDWLLRQFVSSIESRLRIGDLDDFSARMLMEERLVPSIVQDKIIWRASAVTPF